MGLSEPLLTYSWIKKNYSLQCWHYQGKKETIKLMFSCEFLFSVRITVGQWIHHKGEPDTNKSHKTEYITGSHMQQWLIIAQSFSSCFEGKKTSFRGFTCKQVSVWYLRAHYDPSCRLQYYGLHWVWFALINWPGWCLHVQDMTFFITDSLTFTSPVSSDKHREGRCF